jgi:lipoic acid synthetase
VAEVERLPRWLLKPRPAARATRRVRRALEALRLNTVCDEALCPNRGECLGRGTATFLLLGDRCTRDCGFCAVGHGRPEPPDPTEADRVALAARELGLRHVVLTSVTRDDLADGGAEEFARCVRAVRERAPGATVEVLVPDFQGSAAAVDEVLESRPDVFGHNIETVRRLYASTRRGADYGRSLAVLARAAAARGGARVKSALMLGLGETRDEVEDALDDLRDAGVEIVCLGQYLRPSERHLAVRRFLPPEEFEGLRAAAEAKGFAWVTAGPFVRSSYEADRAAGTLARVERLTTHADKETR